MNTIKMKMNKAAISKSKRNDVRYFYYEQQGRQSSTVPKDWSSKIID